jgi:diguanylate cyclase (GGDEF)-like protein
MEDLYKQEMENLLETVPGGIAKLAFDDTLTILNFSHAFHSLFRNIADSTLGKEPVSLLKLVYSADIIYVTQQIAAQKHRRDNLFDINFRTLMPDGSSKWVIITGKKTQETWQSGSNLVPVYSCIATDATNFMLKYKKLEQTNEYRNKIAELSKDLYFEYEIASDSLSFSEMFRQNFGRESTVTGFRGRLEKTNIIHPDELPSVISIYNSMMRGRKQVRFELRMLPKDGVYTWFLCYATIIFDENRNPYKVVGKIAATNHSSSEPEKSVHIPQLDTMTNVCTKESAEFLIREAVKNQETDALSALFVIEIRNFKEINAIRKSIHGENVLTSIAAQLKKHFRSSDIIGRLALGEFIVYMKDVPGDYAVYEMAEKLCKEIEEKHSYSYMQNGITANIGIALHKGVQEYTMLIASANTALVMAKKAPASSFEVVSGNI